MVDFTDRRRFLQLAGTGAAASIAGCADLNPMADDEQHADKITAFVEPDMEELERLQEDLMTGEVSQDEVQDELATLHEEAISSFEAFADDDDGLVIEESERIPGQMGETGLFLLDGEPESIIGTLQAGVVSQLLSGPTFEMVMEQQRQQQEQQQQLPEEGVPEEDLPEEETPEEESPEDDEESSEDDEE